MNKLDKDYKELLQDILTNGVYKNYFNIFNTFPLLHNIYNKGNPLWIL